MSHVGLQSTFFLEFHSSSSRFSIYHFSTHPSLVFFNNNNRSIYKGSNTCAVL